MRQIILFLLLFLSISGIPCEKSLAAENDSIRISMLTCDPGTEIFSLFGHTAIRYENPSRGIDAVFHYGLFSFNTPNFMLRFALGETDYQFGAFDYEHFASEYISEERSVWQQTLNLTNEEKEKLIRLLEENYQPANRVYRYNYFYDNCATRPRDKIEESITGTVEYPAYPADGSKSYREIVHEYTAGHPWARFGIDLCIGSEADRPITRRQMMFSPFYLQDYFEKAVIVDKGEKRALVTKTEKIIDVPQETNQGIWCPTPLQCSLLLFVLTALATIYGIRRKKGLWGVDLALFSLAGIAGCLLAFLAIFSEHPTVSSNYLLFVFHPGQLFFVPYIVYCIRKGKRCWYHTLNFTILTLFMLLFWLIPQRIDFAVVPLALCLLIRSASNLVLTYKNKK